MILILGAALKRETRTMVPMMRFTMIQLGESANHVVVAMKLLLWQVMFCYKTNQICAIAWILFEFILYAVISQILKFIL